MEKRKVFVVISEYNDSNTKPTLVGVFDSEEAFFEEVRKDIENYVNECYTEEDVLTCTKFENAEKMIDSILNELYEYGEVIDPMDDLKVWYFSNPEVQHLDYAGKIRKMVEDKYDSVLILDNVDVTFFPMPFDGGSELCKALSIQSAMRDMGKNCLVINDVDGDFWCFEDQPLHKQKELYDKLKEKNIM